MKIQLAPSSANPIAFADFYLETDKENNRQGDSNADAIKIGYRCITDSYAEQ